MAPSDHAGPDHIVAPLAPKRVYLRGEKLYLFKKYSLFKFGQLNIKYKCNVVYKFQYIFVRILCTACLTAHFLIMLWKC